MAVRLWLKVMVPIEVTDVTEQNLSKNNSAGHIRYSTIAEGTDASLSFTFTAVTEDEIFIHIPTGYARECVLTANSASRGKILGNETERIISLGKFTPGQSVTVKLKLDNQYNDLYIKETEYYFYYLDKNAFETVFEELNEAPQFIVNEGFTDDHLEGTIKTDKASQMILTTIPYDEGWQVIVDGEPVRIFKVADALIAFEIDTAGEHTLEFKYAPKIVILGAIISLSSTILFAGIIVVPYLLKKRKAATRPSRNA